MAEQVGTQSDAVAQAKPGRVVLFGSGETSSSGRKVHDRLFRTLSPPINVAILETPAGFQPNSRVVAEEVADFLRHRLRNFQPQVAVVPARRKGGTFSPDDPGIVAPVLSANYIFLGPGSPTYTVRHLRDTLAWRYVLAAQRRGAVLALASAASIAAGAHTLPVYEIYKAGHDLHWVRGLDFFGDYGLELAIIPHWNNSDGGKKLDTRCCFMGWERMDQLEKMLPDTTTLLGLDEHTAIVFDFSVSMCEVIGKSTITVRAGGRETSFQAGATFPMDLLGDVRTPAFEDEAWTPAAVDTPSESEPALPAEVRDLIAQRQVARDTCDWEEADRLRDRVAGLGFDIQDTRNGPRWRPRGTQAKWRALEYVRKNGG